MEEEEEEEVTFCKTKTNKNSSRDIHTGLVWEPGDNTKSTHRVLLDVWGKRVFSLGEFDCLGKTHRHVGEDAG